MAQRKASRSKIAFTGHAPLDRAGVPDSAEFCARLRAHLAAELEKPCPEASPGITNFEALSERLVQMAVGGSKDAIHIVLDRMGGRAPQAPPNQEEPVEIEYVIGIPRPSDDEENPSFGDAVPAVPPSG